MPNEMDPHTLAQQVMNAANSLTDEEAGQRYQQILAQLPSDQAAELNTLALSQVGATDRQHMASQLQHAHQNPASSFDGYNYDTIREAASPANLGRMTAQAQQQDPGLLGGILGNNSALAGQIGKAALAALATLLIRRMMSSQNSGSSQASSAGGAGAIGSILGSLLGGGSSSGSYSSGGSNDPLGGLLGSLLGGSSSGGGGSYGNQPVPQTGQTGAGSIDLGSILGGLLGSGGVTQQTSQGGGLGSILGSILSGVGGSAMPDTSTVPDTTSSAPGAGTHRKQGIQLGNDKDTA